MYSLDELGHVGRKLIVSETLDKLGPHQLSANFFRLWGPTAASEHGKCSEMILNYKGKMIDEVNRTKGDLQTIEDDLQTTEDDLQTKEDDLDITE